MNTSYMKWTLLNNISQVCTTIDLCRKIPEAELAQNWSKEELLISQYQPEIMMSQYTTEVGRLLTKLLDKVEGESYHPVLLLHSVIVILTSYARSVEDFNVTMVSTFDDEVGVTGNVNKWMLDNFESEASRQPEEGAPVEEVRLAVLKGAFIILCNEVNKIYNLPSEISNVDNPNQTKMITQKMIKNLLSIMDVINGALSNINEVGIGDISESPAAPTGYDIPDEVLEGLKNMSAEELAMFNVPDVEGGDETATSKEAFRRIPETLDLIKKLGIQEAGKLISDRNKK